MHINIRLSLILLPLLLIAIAQALAVVEVVPSEMQSRSFEIPTSLANVTRYELVHASSASARDLDLTARGPSGISRYIEDTKRQNVVAAAVYGGIAGGFASGLATTCSIGGVLTGGSACIVNVVLFALFFFATNYYLFYAPKPPRSLASDTVWTVDPEYVPTIDCGIKCKLAASAPLDKFATFGNVTTDGNFYHLAYYRSSKTATRGLRITRNATLSITTSKTKRQDQGDFEDDPGSDGEVDYSSYVYWGEGSEDAFDEWNEDFAGDDQGLAESYGDWVGSSDSSVSCMTVTESNEADEELVSLWYFSNEPGVAYEAPPDEVEELMDLCVTLG